MNSNAFKNKVTYKLFLHELYICIYIYIYKSPGGNTPQSTNYTATCLPSRKLSKLDEPDTQDTAGEAETSSKVMYYYGPPHIAEQKQDDQLEHTYSRRIRDVVLKTCQRRWTKGKSGERGSGISVLAVGHDDIYIYILCERVWKREREREREELICRKTKLQPNIVS